MSKAYRSSAARMGSGQSLANAVRPGMEAAVLAAVAFGCAHAGWAILAPPALGSLDTRGAEEGWRADVATAQVDEAAVLVSPFAPDVADAAGVSNAASAYASTVQLVGVRMADDPARSGAIVAVQDGSQRAFMIGQELSAGVHLARVTTEGIVLRYEGGERQLSFPAAPQSFSFAAAMMGRVEIPPENALAAAPSSETLVAVDADARATPFAATVAAVKVAPNMLSAALAPAPAVAADETVLQYFGALIAGAPGGVPADGLRLVGPLPPSVSALGLLEGDVVLAINGVAAKDAPSLLAAGLAGPVEISVRRATDAPIVVRASLQAPA